MKKLNNDMNPMVELSNKQPFTVPDKYFDDFDARLQMRIEQQNLIPKSGNTFVRVLKPVVWLAACFVLVFLLVKLPLSQLLPEYLSKNDVVEEDYSISVESLDEDAFYDIIAEDLHADVLETAEIFDYLTAEISEYEIYAEMSN